MNIAYVRVSTIEQNEARQVEGLNEKFKIDKWFKEKVSAKDTNRPKLNEMLAYAREGDIIYIWDFSRLARSTKYLLELVDAINNKGIILVSVKENIDTSTANGKLMLTLIGAINEFERTNLLERQKEGIAIAKRNGKYKGRKKIKRPKNFIDVYNRWRCRELTGIKAMELLEVKKNTFYNLIKEYEAELKA
ncbi:MAG: recombinase family protein [Clostridium sp.]|uniref:recombinase family protein n=1 Tax=Clostridium sp. TaxID=1506 RepID=UPI003EE514D6